MGPEDAGNKRALAKSFMFTSLIIILTICKYVYTIMDRKRDLQTLGMQCLALGAEEGRPLVRVFRVEGPAPGVQVR